MMTCSSTELDDLINSTDCGRRAVEPVADNRRIIIRQTRRSVDGSGDKPGRFHRLRSTRRGHHGDRLGGLVVDRTSTETTDDVSRVTWSLVDVNVTETDTSVSDREAPVSGNRCTCRQGHGVVVIVDSSSCACVDKSRHHVISLVEDNGGDHVAPISRETADESRAVRGRWQCLKTVSGTTFRMKKSRLREAAACVRALRHSGDVKRRLMNINYSEIRDVTKTTRTTSIISNERRRSIRATANREDDGVNDVVVTSTTSQFEWTSCADKFRECCRLVSSSRIDFLSSRHYDNRGPTSGLFRWNSGDCWSSIGSNELFDRMDNDVSSSGTDSVTEVSSDLSHLIERLIQLEQAFISAMTRGIQIYSRPLSFHLLTSTEHLTLFQNIEKLVILAEGHVSLLKRLHEVISHQASWKVECNALRDYSQHADCTQHAYLDYCNGLLQAVILCRHLITSKSQFSDYVQMCHKLHVAAPNILEFIQLPVCYPCHVFSWFVDLRHMTSPSTSFRLPHHDVFKVLSARYDSILTVCAAVLPSLTNDR